MHSFTISAVLLSASLASGVLASANIPRALLHVRQGGDAFIPGTRQGFGATCVDAFGPNSKLCANSGTCYDASIGDSCCSEGYPCGTGSYCLVKGYCCPNVCQFFLLEKILSISVYLIRLFTVQHPRPMRSRQRHRPPRWLHQAGYWIRCPGCYHRQGQHIRRSFLCQSHHDRCRSHHLHPRHISLPPLPHRKLSRPTRTYRYWCSRQRRIHCPDWHIFRHSQTLHRWCLKSEDRW